jgi:hypothetical protein
VSTTVIVIGIAIVLIGVVVILVSLRDSAPGAPIRGRKRVGVVAAVIGAVICIAGIVAAVIGY